MSAGILYLDSSAIVKLVVRESETLGLIRFLQDWPDCVSSVLARVEVQRAIRRTTSDASKIRRTGDVLKGINLISIDETILSNAGAMPPVELRALDAIHIATALSIADDLAALVTYDDRMSQAATSRHIKVWSPK